MRRPARSCLLRALGLTSIIGSAIGTGCGGTASPEAAGPTDSVLLADLERQATDAFLAIGDLLVDYGLEPYFAVVDYFGCDSPTPEYVVDAYGRYDHADGRSSTRDDAEAIRDLLADNGWTATESHRFTNGIDESGTGWLVRATTADIDVEVWLYNSNKAVAVRVSGDCVPVDDQLHDELFVTEPRDLDIGATTTTAASSTVP